MYFRPFSCKGFFLCPSSSQKRTLLFAEYLDDQIEHAGCGPGIDTLMRLYPKRRLGVVVMGNVNDYGATLIVPAEADILPRQGR